MKRNAHTNFLIQLRPNFQNKNESSRAYRFPVETHDLLIS